MMDHDGPIEAVLSSDQRGEPYNFSLWDINTGAQIVLFKGSKNTCIPNCMQLIDNNFFITASDNVLQIWSIYNRKCQDQKLFLPGRPTSLCVTPCANYLSVAISESIYIWQIHSGNLMAHTQRHYQTVSVLKMSPDGSLLFSGGEDGIVLIWPFADLISGTHHNGSLNIDSSRRDVGVNEPRYSLQHHNSPVSDLHATNGGRLISVSLDSTVNIYSYLDGKRLYCISMPSPLHCLVMNKNETTIYLGAKDGNIYELFVSAISISKLRSNIKDSSNMNPLFTGHKDKITCLAISADGTRLISGSNDCTCKVWDTRSKKLIRDIKHQATISNLINFLVPESLALTTMSKTQIKLPLKIKPLKRSLYKHPKDGTIVSDDFFEESSSAIVHVSNKDSQFEAEMLKELRHQTNKNQLDYPSITMDNAIYDGSTQNVEVVNRLKRKIQELYKFSAEKIFKEAAMDPSLCPE